MPLALLLALDLAVFPPREPREIVWPECYCTDSVGRRVELGEEACLVIGPRSFTARCEMARSQRNPIWRDVHEGCEGRPQSRLPSLLERLQGGEPVLHACLVDPHVPVAEPGAGEDGEG